MHFAFLIFVNVLPKTQHFPAFVSFHFFQKGAILPLQTKKRRKQKMNTDKIYAESIVNEYSVKATSKVVALKKLDRKAKRPSDIFAYCLGVISALILGVGMCLCMGEIGGNTTGAIIGGVIVGLIGIIGCSINYPLYKALRKKGKAKYAADIILLAKEIADEKE